MATLSERIAAADPGRIAHLRYPCRPARPDRCAYCREAAARSGSQWVQRMARNTYVREGGR